MHYHRLGKLNYRVRDGNGCDLYDMVAGRTAARVFHLGDSQLFGRKIICGSVVNPSVRLRVQDIDGQAFAR